jgi:hypothetical protein
MDPFVLRGKTKSHKQGKFTRFSSHFVRQIMKLSVQLAIVLIDALMANSIPVHPRTNFDIGIGEPVDGVQNFRVRPGSFGTAKHPDGSNSNILGVSEFRLDRTSRGRPSASSSAYSTPRNYNSAPLHVRGSPDSEIQKSRHLNGFESASSRIPALRLPDEITWDSADKLITLMPTSEPLVKLPTLYKLPESISISGTAFTPNEPTSATRLFTFPESIDVCAPKKQRRRLYIDDNQMSDRNLNLQRPSPVYKPIPMQSQAVADPPARSYLKKLFSRFSWFRNRPSTKPVQKPAGKKRTFSCFGG